MDAKIWVQGNPGLEVSIGCPVDAGSTGTPKSQFWVSKVTYFSGQTVKSCLPTGCWRQGRSLNIFAVARSFLRASAGVQDSRCRGPTTHSSDS